MVAGLWFTAPATPTIVPAEASQHEGRVVHVHGVVVDVSTWSDGGRFRIAHDGHALEARIQGPPPPMAAWVEVQGALHRHEGSLWLWADHWNVEVAPQAATVPLALVANQPAAWTDRRVAVQGDMEAHLSDGFHVMQLANGPRLQGPVVATGVIAYDAGCVCHRMHVDAVRPWSR